MAVLKSLRRGRSVAQILIIALLIGGAPSFCSVILQPSGPAFTLDICHPPPGVDRSAGGASFAAPLPSWVFIQALADRGAAPASRGLWRSRLNEPPNPPPPRTLA